MLRSHFSSPLLQHRGRSILLRYTQKLISMAFHFPSTKSIFILLSLCICSCLHVWPWGLFSSGGRRKCCCVEKCGRTKIFANSLSARRTQHLILSLTVCLSGHCTVHSIPYQSEFHSCQLLLATPPPDPSTAAAHELQSTHLIHGKYESIPLGSSGQGIE